MLERDVMCVRNGLINGPVYKSRESWTCYSMIGEKYYMKSYDSNKQPKLQ